VGIVPGWSGTQRLARLVPEPVLREMALFGRRISSDRCRSFGFAAEVAADPRAAAEAIAAQVADLSPRAVEIAKAMIHAAVGEDSGAMIEALGSAAIAASNDRAEGVAAFARSASHVSRGPDHDRDDRHPVHRNRAADTTREPPFDRRRLGGSARAKRDRLSPSHGLVVSRSATGWRGRGDGSDRGGTRGLRRRALERLPARTRARVLLRVADLIEANVDDMALIETLESGKPITQARGEVAGAADLWRYAAALARTVEGDSFTTALGKDILATVLKEPIGVVSIITPWNFPFWILSQKLPFALAAGCTCVVKPSEMTPSTTVMLGELLIRGRPAGGRGQHRTRLGDPVGATLARHRDVDMVTFTGSTAVGG
jgi:hypothetical protein